MSGAGTVGENGAVGKNHNNFVKNAIFLANTTDSTVVPGAPRPEEGGGFPLLAGGGFPLPEGAGGFPLRPPGTEPEGGLIFPGLTNDGCGCDCIWGIDNCDCACGHGASSISNGISLLYRIMVLAFWLLQDSNA